jgi:ATPase subunit of ABC transporter with duplicated ATPase domains
MRNFARSKPNLYVVYNFDSSAGLSFQDISLDACDFLILQKSGGNKGFWPWLWRRDVIESLDIAGRLALWRITTEEQVGVVGEKFSGGQAKRLGLACGIAERAPILLLDEPGRPHP